ncbi:arginase family protein [Salinispora arenicola]|uniref:arginase family protein n=1 Tax=Salinispora arenicola TaxID=168697 RepID=UPI000380AA8D|nr:arginase family protein [Salinispora arenicola]
MTAMIELITAPSSLGLSPQAPGHEPGAWRAPAVLLGAGLAERLRAVHVVELGHPRYDFGAQPGTRIRNGRTLRAHSLEVAEAVAAAIDASTFPVVVGGDCSVLLGCLLGARRGGRCGLLHIDGHSDFRHPNTYDTTASLGSVAGMDLAVATGRGEPILTHWPQVGTPLVTDEDVIQLGDRESDITGSLDDWTPVMDSAVLGLTAQQVLGLGVDQVVKRVVERLNVRELDRVWLHLDLDVLDEKILPAVDSPGSPGLDFMQVSELLTNLVHEGRVLGLDVTVYDPELDPGTKYADSIVECLVRGLV